MRVRAVHPHLLVEALADRIAGTDPALPCRVAVDGSPATRPSVLADGLLAPLRLRGRPPLRVSAQSFLRPASLRLEHGREDPDAYYDDWLDTGTLAREVLDPLGPGGSGRYLPTFWDTARDRATRAAYATAPPGSVLVLDGALLLGRGLPFELTVHLAMSPAALRRHTPEQDSWTLAAYERYRSEVAPEETADVVVRVDHPDRPAVVEADAD